MCNQDPRTRLVAHGSPAAVPPLPEKRGEEQPRAPEREPDPNDPLVPHLGPPGLPRVGDCEPGDLPPVRINRDLAHPRDQPVEVPVGDQVGFLFGRHGWCVLDELGFRQMPTVAVWAGVGA